MENKRTTIKDQITPRGEPTAPPFFPGGNKMALKNRLTKEFVGHTKGRRSASGSQTPIIDPQDPNFEEVQKLMSEGL